MKKIKNSKAFTLVELVIVIAVIAILASVLLPTFTGIINNAKESSRVQQVTTARTEMLTFSNKIITNSDLEGYIFVIDNNVYTLDNIGQVVKVDDLYYTEVESNYEKSTTQPTNPNVVVYLPKKFFTPTEIPLTFTLDEINKTATVKSFLNTITPTYSIPAYVGKYDSETDKYYVTGENTYRVVGIEDFAFQECNIITDVTMPNTITNIGMGAFFGCSSLKNIKLSDDLITMGIGSFCECIALESISLPNTLTNIEIATFSDCESLTSIVLPNSVENIGDEAFGYCKSLSNINFSSNLKTIGNKAFFECKSLTNIVLPNTVESIGNEAFCDCVLLKNITWSNNLTNLGEAAFSGCAFETLILPNSLLIIPDSAFYRCEALISVTLPNNTTTIEDDAFMSCHKLTTITIPKSVTIIGSRAFKCNSLTEIIFEHSASDNLTIADGLNGAFRIDININTTIKCLLDDEYLPLNSTIKNHNWNETNRDVCYYVY